MRCGGGGSSRARPRQASPRPRRRAGAAGPPCGGAGARAARDRRRPRAVGAGIPLRRPARDRLDRGRVRHRAPRRRRARRRADRARDRLAGRDRGTRRGTAGAAAPDLARDGDALHVEAASARALRRGGRPAAGVRGLLRRGRGGGGGGAHRLSVRHQGAGPPGPARADARPRADEVEEAVRSPSTRRAARRCSSRSSCRDAR